ncbi:hypothetical protein HPB49_003015 [Dermacentor silvarum]|uniref:Uncharacterized protein n=1 Tax=Dermacentor silvarum TaxID=543639 RepID=A0ACB8DI84_DERSI|nr:hypothetical protein HPB49_003015 [Dermacentor silvarum]
MQELIRRRALKSALAGRSGKDLDELMLFVTKNLTDHRFSRIMLDVAALMVEVYYPEVTTCKATCRRLKILQKTFYDKVDVKQVDVPSYSGSFGILPNHVPALAVIKPGVVTVFEKEGEAKKYFGKQLPFSPLMSSGTISINEDSSVQVLAEAAVPVDRLDPQLCRDGLTKAQQALQSASSDTARAEAQIEVEVHEALVKALE